MKKYTKNDVYNLAKKITGNSEVFGDEIESVAFQLSSLSATANQYGCEMQGIVSDMWGNDVSVVAVPDVYRHEWTF